MKQRSKQSHSAGIQLFMCVLSVVELLWHLLAGRQSACHSGAHCWRSFLLSDLCGSCLEVNKNLHSGFCFLAGGESAVKELVIKANAAKNSRRDSGIIK